MKYSDREKDKALASYYNGAACADDDLTAMLKDDGYIVRVTSPNGIVTRITDKGRIDRYTELVRIVSSLKVRQ